MKMHWCVVGKDGMGKFVPHDETRWVTACGIWLTDEEAEAGRGSPNVGDATCGSCRRVAAAQVELRLTRGVLQEIPL